jgi:DNA ligase-1
MSWRAEFRSGVWLPQVGWWLDAHFPVERSFVSHAHSDHIAAHSEILCSPTTARLMRARLSGRRREHLLPFGHTEALTEDCHVTLHPAGHILGSAQALFEHEKFGRLLYTGDFKLRPGLSAEPCAMPSADVLIMETTFGRPHYVFPPTAEVLRAITSFCHLALDDGEVPVLFGYSLGKSQELLCGLAAAGLPVMLHPQALRLTQIYAATGVALPPYVPFAAETCSGHVVICPPQGPSSPFLRQIPRRRTAMISGWAVEPGAVHRYQCDAAFPLSDHADYPDLLRFVEAVGPRRVLTLHGFAREFATTLRERGIEAWAIGEDNQLEFALGSQPRPTPPQPDPSPPLGASTEPVGTAESFYRFATTAEEVGRLERKSEKVATLADYLGALPVDAAASAALFFTARPFPQSDQRRLGIGWALLKRALLEVAGATEAEYRARRHRFADAGEAAQAMLPPDARSRGLTLDQIGATFALLAATNAPKAKLELLRDLLQQLCPLEGKYWVKLVLGDLRIGLKDSLVEESMAVSAGIATDAIRTASMLVGDIGAVTRAARNGTIAQLEHRVFQPVQFMLASPEPDAASILARLPAPVWLEEKYDGIRLQVHKLGPRVEIYSRDLHRLTTQFTELTAALSVLPGDFVLDGELLAWRDDRALPFAELQKRLGRQGDDFFLGAAIPVSVSAYDLLWLDGRSLLAMPLATRRRELEGLANRWPQPCPLRLAPVQFAADELAIEAAFLAARQRGNEGLMAKDPASAYTPGRRGLAWLKLKKTYATLDVVVVAAEYGHGRRRGVLSDYTFAVRDDATGNLLTVGKAYSGLTDAEIASLTQHFLAHTLEVSGRVHRVVPDTVLEVAFDSIQPSDRHASGFALRFPRIARIRTDKLPSEIDTLRTCQTLAGAPGRAG